MCVLTSKYNWVFNGTFRNAHSDNSLCNTEQKHDNNIVYIHHITDIDQFPLVLDMCMKRLIYIKHVFEEFLCYVCCYMLLSGFKHSIISIQDQCVYIHCVIIVFND